MFNSSGVQEGIWGGNVGVGGSIGKMWVFY